MNQENAKTIPLNQESSQEHRQEQNDKFGKDILEGVKKDMGKAALIVSLLTLVLVVILYFSLQNNMAGLNQKVSEMTAVTEKVNQLDSTVSSMDKRLGQLENLPEQTRSLIYTNVLGEMEQKAGYLSGNLQGEQKQKLNKARELLGEVNKGIQKSVQ